MNKAYPFVSIVTVNYNGKQLLKNCFDSLSGLDYPKDRLEIFMVDNASRDGSVDYVKKQYSNVQVLKNNINNYCKANNLGIVNSKGEYVAFLNNDTKVDQGWLMELIKVINSDQEVGAVGSKILYMDGKIQSAGHIEYPNYYWADRGRLEEDGKQYNKIEEVSSISNCSALYRRKAIAQAGTFDEDFNMYMEDVDMAFRLRHKGWKILFVPKSIIYHALHGTKQKSEEKDYFITRNRLLFIVKHYPEKLAESISGFGQIIEFSNADFQKILASISNKLFVLHGAPKAKKIMSELQKSVEMLDGYRQHSFRIELDRRTWALRKELMTKDKQIVSLQDQLGSRAAQLQAQTAEDRVKNERIKANQEAVFSLEENLCTKDEQIAFLQEQINARDTRIHSLETETGDKEDQLKAKQEAIASLQKALLAKEEQFPSLQENVRARDEQITSLQEQISSKDAQLQIQETEASSKEDQLRAKQESIASLQEQISSKDARIQDLETETNSKGDQLKASQEATASLQENVRARDEQITSLQEQISSKDARIQDLETETNSKGDQLKDKQEAMASLQKALLAKDEQLLSLQANARTKDEQIATLQEKISSK
ncbi:MAG: glycosyltransferase, partial [Candidatus Omnitrophota bacterium]